MRRCNNPLKIVALAALALAAAPIAAQETQPAPEPSTTIALMGTIPIYWGEADGFDEMLAGEAQPHWARAVLERRATLVVFDYLSAEALAPHRALLLAQPRGLTAEENVALDSWVRGGGHVLLFADPMMTGESRFGIGDRRRPQDVALLSPILAHWGLELMIDAAQAEELTFVNHSGESLPVNMRGVWAPRGGSQDCAIAGDGLLAHCGLGLGQVLLVADAALLDLVGPYAGAEAGFESLLADIFPQFGESAGVEADPAPQLTGNRQFSCPECHHDHHQTVIGEGNSP